MIHIIRNGSDRVLFLTNRLEFYRINEHTDEIINAMLQNIDHSIIERRYSTSSEEIASIKKVLKRDEQLAIIATEYPILRKLILNISNSCNLQCEYCYANGGNYHSKDSLMDSATAKDAIDKFIYMFKEIQYVQFFGGEPLLNYQLMEYVCEYITNLYKTEKIHIMPQFGIVTNGTIINDNILRILSVYNIAVTISCDGPREINDKLRVNKNHEGVYCIISKNIERIQKEANILPNIEVTYTKYHHDQGIKIVDLLNFFKKRFNIENVHVAPVSIEKTHELALANYEDFLETISSENIKKNNIIFKVRNIIYNLQHKCGDCKICGAGTDTFSVNVDGNVYPCFMMTDIEAHNIANTKMNKDEFMNSLKKAKNTYSFNKCKQLPCSNCFNNLLCNGCMGNNYFETNDPFVPSGEQCKFLKELTERVILELSNLK